MLEWSYTRACGRARSEERRPGRFKMRFDGAMEYCTHWTKAQAEWEPRHVYNTHVDDSCGCAYCDPWPEWTSAEIERFKAELAAGDPMAVWAANTLKRQVGREPVFSLIDTLGKGRSLKVE